MSAWSPAELRRRFREGRCSMPTASLAPGYLQANLAVVPDRLAAAFEDFLQANPAACPLLARGERGDPGLPALGPGIDVRFDLPRYRVFRHGRPIDAPTAIDAYWRADLVAFAVGCSLSFEADLRAAGIDLRCFRPGANCAAFDTALPLVRVGPFGGNLVVTMRAVPRGQVERVIAVTRAHPEAHGAPVHVGEPAAIGVDLARPIDGIGLTDLRPGEVAVFWACGVSMERAIATAAPDLAITHAPGCMLITDRPARRTADRAVTAGASTPSTIRG